MLVIQRKLLHILRALNIDANYKSAIKSKGCALRNLGNILSKKGNLTGAKTYYEETKEYYEKALKVD